MGAVGSRYKNIYIFCAPTISASYISLEECSHLAIGAEWEPSGASKKTDVFCRFGVHLDYLNRISAKQCLHLAMGAEWELSGADTKTHIFCAPTISISHISLEACSHLAIGAEWEPVQKHMFFVLAISR